MAYKLDISPTGKRSLVQILQRYPHPEVIEALRSRMDRLAEDPVRNGDHNPTIHGRPWVLVKCNVVGTTLYFQIAYRFAPGEERIEILDLKVLSM